MMLERNASLKLSVLVLSMLLLGLGSDTAFQRWNIISYTPMALGVIWPMIGGKSRSVLRKSILMSLPTLFLVVAFKYYWVETHVSIIETDGKFKNVKCEPGWVQNYIEIKRVIERLDSEEVSYAFAGSGLRYLYAYEFEDNNNIVFPLHNYHWSDGSEILEQFNNKCDAIIYVSDYQKDFATLKELYGYEIIEKTTAYTLCGDKRLELILANAKNGEY